MAGQPGLYSNVNTTKMLEQSQKSLIRYGGSFLPLIITKAEGVFVYTSTGQKILDWTSGQMSTLLGHGNPEIVKTIHDHALQLDHLLSGMLSPPVIELAEKLTSLLPEGLDKAMFLNTGAESNEAAIKMAKFYTGKWEIVALGGSWHGMTGAAHASTYQSGRRGYGPFIPGNLVLPTPNAYRSKFRNPDGSYDWESELNYGWDLVDQASAGSLAAVILEPILSSGGMLVLPPGYLQSMKENCRKRGMLLIVDEAQTAIGRSGSMFAFEHDGATPDILTLSKTLGNGLPLAAVVTSTEIEKTCNENGFIFYTTHANDPLPAAVGLKVLDIVVRDGLVERSRKLGLKLQDGLKTLKNKYACIGDVRGRGLMAGIEIIGDPKTKQPALELGNALASRMYELGLSANLATVAAFAGVFRIAPPITVTEDELSLGLGIMEEAFKSVPGTLNTTTQNGVGITKL
ncbi:MAG: hypothetical protein M1834_008803 [Cirrosporium novae-zelandiae]|nr:MAG: hypothetical protein M1834_008803 [Cirrosporium novae-zelandiae]